LGAPPPTPQLVTIFRLRDSYLSKMMTRRTANYVTHLSGARDTDRQYWTAGELALRWEVSRSVVYKWISNDVLPANRLGPKLYRIPAAAVTRFERANQGIIPSGAERQQRTG
jgi:excisionase family DNA binding protein